MIAYEWTAGALTAFVFLGILKWVRIEKTTERMLVLAARSLGIIGTHTLTDLQKEKQLQRNSLRIALYLLQLLAWVLLALSVCAGVLFVVWWFFRKWAFSEAPFLPSFSWQFMLSSTAASVVLWWYMGIGSSNQGYSFWQRALHRMAFASVGLQMRWLQKKQQRKETKAPLEKARPVFITGLPRAGSTILLKSLYTHGNFVSQTYRDMPFVLLPKQWTWINKWFAVKGKEHPRPHGDGIVVHVDSPESLDEVAWKAAVAELEANEQQDFIRLHVQRLMDRTDEKAVYLSKNNALLHRLEELRTVFPLAVIVCLFREPMAHAYSLWQQHLRFKELQKADSFVLEYMNDIGQHYFGAGLVLKQWGDWPATANYTDPDEFMFWLEQWVAAYTMVLQRQGDKVHWLSYETFCAQPEWVLQGIASSCGIALIEGEGLEVKESSASVNIDSIAIDKLLVGKAEKLYAALQKME